MAVIVATGGTETVTAAKRATSTIPIVFTTGGDPVRLGLVASLNRPGGNITGATPFTRQLGPKRLGLLQAIVPTATVVAVLVNRNELDSEAQLRDVQEAGRTVGVQILPLWSVSARVHSSSLVAHFLTHIACNFACSRPVMWFPQSIQFANSLWPAAS